MLSPAGTGADSGSPAREAGSPRRDFADRLSWVLDELFRVPFTRLRFGLDFLLGLVPGVGDFIGMALGLPILVIAVRQRVGWRVLLMMLVNVLLDAVLGVVPIAGNLFDFFWKAHRKNLLLLKKPAALGDVLREAGWKLAALIALCAMLMVTLFVGLLLILDLYRRLMMGSL